MDKIELASHFDESMFVPALQARNKEGVLEELTNRFAANGLVRNAALVLEMIHRREDLGSTGIGHGIAIPHGRTTAAAKLKIAFGYSKRGIAWGALDGKPVHLVFMVLSPPHEQDNRYLPVLGRLVEILSQADEREKFSQVTTYSEFTNLLKS